MKKERTRPDSYRATIDPAELPTWEPDMPAEWTEPVDHGNGMENAKKIAREAAGRSKWSHRAVTALNVAISVAARVAGVSELNNLKINMENDMQRIKPVLKRKTFWEGVAALLGAAGIVIYPDAIIEIVTGVFVIIGGIEMWKKEPEN